MGKYRKGYRSIKFKILLTLIVSMSVLLVGELFFLQTFFQSSIDETARKNLAHMDSDLRVALGGEKWNIKNNAIYNGELLIGDGTEKNANIRPFVEFERYSGAMCYIFMKTTDDGLKWSGDKSTGYQEGHYIRVAGSTKDANGKSIVGTYMQKKVADALDINGVYEGRANVAGRILFCRYTALFDKNKKLIGAIVMGETIDSMTRQVNSAMQVCFGIMSIIFLLGIGLIYYIIRGWISKLKEIREYLHAISENGLPEDKICVNGSDEISDISESINKMVVSLKEKERITGELNVANGIQAHMLPTLTDDLIEDEKFDLYATMRTAKEVGGDFYDFFRLDDKHIVCIIADVSGKGVSAALIMAITKTLVRNYAQSGLPIDAVFARANQTLCERNEAGMFVTAWIGVLNLKTGNFEYVNAGHNKPLVKRNNGTFEFLETKPNLVLGAFESTVYEKHQLKLEPGDEIFIYTDGVTEALYQDEMYGNDRLRDFLNFNEFWNAKDLVENLLQDVDKFVDGGEQFDDITMLSLKFRNKKDDDGMREREFLAAIDNYTEVSDFTETYLNENDVPQNYIFSILTAIEEIYVNISHYAYSNEMGKVFISIGIIHDEVVVKIADNGVPFNPLEVPEPDVSLSAEERDIGGLGIFMTKHIMDVTEYEYKNRQNILTLKKKIQKK